eukprot:5519335-Pyramimonas_sp.AAC.1
MLARPIVIGHKAQHGGELRRRLVDQELEHEQVCPLRGVGGDRKEPCVSVPMKRCIQTNA